MSIMKKEYPGQFTVLSFPWINMALCDKLVPGAYPALEDLPHTFTHFINAETGEKTPLFVYFENGEKDITGFDIELVKNKMFDGVVNALELLGFNPARRMIANQNNGNTFGGATQQSVSDNEQTAEKKWRQHGTEWIFSNVQAYLHNGAKLSAAAGFGMQADPYGRSSVYYGAEGLAGMMLAPNKTYMLNFTFSYDTRTPAELAQQTETDKAYRNHGMGLYDNMYVTKFLYGTLVVEAQLHIVLAEYFEDAFQSVGDIHAIMRGLLDDGLDSMLAAQKLTDVAMLKLLSE